MLCTVEGRVQPMVAAGRPAAEVLASAPTADFDAAWGRDTLLPETCSSV
jgi:hypothetical protein